MKNTNNTNQKYVYFLSLEKIEEQHGVTPDKLKELDGVAVMANEKLNIGCVDGCLVSLDWCEKLSSKMIGNDQMLEILESFNDKELYTPLEEILYESFIEAGKKLEKTRIDALNLSRALGFVFDIIDKNKEAMPVEDLIKLEVMNKALKKAMFGEE